MIILLFACTQNKADSDTGWVWGTETWDVIGTSWMEFCVAKNNLVRCTNGVTVEFPDHVTAIRGGPEHIIALTESGNAYAFNPVENNMLSFPIQHVVEIESGYGYMPAITFRLLSEDGIIYDSTGSVINDEDVWVDFIGGDELYVMTSATQTILTKEWTHEEQDTVLNTSFSSLETSSSTICGRNKEEVSCFFNEATPIFHLNESFIEMSLFSQLLWCGVSDIGSISCYNLFYTTEPYFFNDRHQFIDVEFVYNDTCGLRDDHILGCWQTPIARSLE